MNRFGSVVALGLLGSLAPACSGDGSEGGAGPGSAAGTGGSQSAGAGGAGNPAAGGSGPAGSGGQPSAPRGSEVTLEGNTIRATITARNVPPGEDQHVCVVVPLPNEEPIWVNKLTGILEGGSHHLIVDRSTREPQLEPEVCGPTPGGDATRLIIVQQAEAVVQLPEGVAFSLEARQPLFLQLHYYNAGDETRDIVGHVELEMMAPSAPTPIEAQSIFTGRIGFSLPANSPSTIVSYVQPVPSQGTRHVFALTSHTHALGVHAQIERVANADAPTTTPIHVSEDWEEPPLTLFSPPLPFTGADGLRLTCQYENTRSHPVSFGTAATDEMCFMWVYYYDR
jgi:hypothetical protein